MADKYPNFATLAQHERSGIDYASSFVERSRRSRSSHRTGAVSNLELPRSRS